MRAKTRAAVDPKNMRRTPRLGAHDDEVRAKFRGGSENLRIGLATPHAALDRQRIDAAPLCGARQQLIDLPITRLFEPVAFARERGSLREERFQNMDHAHLGAFLASNRQGAAHERV